MNEKDYAAYTVILQKEGNPELNDRLKKIKVLARAIYTEATARMMQYGPGKDFDLKEVAEDCIKSAMEFEGAFAIFEHNSIRDGRLFLFENEEGK